MFTAQHSVDDFLAGDAAEHDQPVSFPVAAAPPASRRFTHSMYHSRGHAGASAGDVTTLFHRSTGSAEVSAGNFLDVPAIPCYVSLMHKKIRWRLSRLAAVPVTGLAAVAMLVTAGGASAETFTCTTSAQYGECPANGQGYTSYPGFQPFAAQENFGSPYVDMNEWGPVSGETQTLSANSPGDWQVTNFIPAGNNPTGGVTTYPNAGMALNNPAITSYPDITSSFADTIPSANGNVGWQGYDNWFNGWKDEVMIQTQWTGAAPCTYETVQQFTEPGTGIPQTWGLCNFGGPGNEKVWKLAPAGTQPGGSATVNETSGSVDVSAMTDYLILHGYMVTTTLASTTVTALSAGFEICQTQPGGSTWSYSNLSFSTSGGGTSQQPPAASTGTASNITTAAATLNGTVNPEGADTHYQFDYGTTTAYGSSTTSADAGTGTADVNASAGITGLTAGTVYHYRVEASNSAGTTDGSDQTFTTASVPQPPAVTTGSVSGTSSTGGTLNGTVNPEGQATTYQFDYGTTTAYGSSAPAGGASAGSGTTAVSESATLTGLSPSTVYHYRIEASNPTGITDGSDATFTTSAQGTGVVSYDATSTAHVTNSGTLNWTHTVGSGADRALLVSVATGISDDTGCTVAVTDAGTPMTLIGTAHSNGQTAGFLSVFGAYNPPSGANTVSVHVTGCPFTPDSVIGGGESFANVAQGSSPHGFSALNTATGSASPAQATIVSNTGNMLAGFAVNGSPITSVVSPATSRYVVNVDSNTAAGNSSGASQVSTGSSVTVKWNIQSDWWAAGVMEVRHD